MSVALDAHVLIWALPFGISDRTKKKKQNDHLREMQRRSAILIKELERDKQIVIVPLVSVAEFLVGIRQEHHASVIAQFHSRFICPPFDIRACALAAKLEQTHRGFPKSEQVERKHLRADAMIVATAKVNGASKFYSHEAACRRMAQEANMIAEDLPTHPSDLFTQIETTPKDE